MSTPVSLTEEQQSTLRSTLLLNGMSEEDYDQLYKLACPIQYPQEEYLFLEGEMNDAIYIIISGEVALYKRDEHSEKEYLIARLGSGQTLGEFRIIIDSPCTLSAKAVNTVVAVSFPIASLRNKNNYISYTALLEAIINILKIRLLEENKIIVKDIKEKKITTRNLIVSGLVIIALAFILMEVGFAFYYLTHTSDFCNLQSQANAVSN